MSKTTGCINIPGRKKAPDVNPATPIKTAALRPLLSPDFPGIISYAIIPVRITVSVEMIVGNKRTANTDPPSIFEAIQLNAAIDGGTDAKPQSRCLLNARYKRASRCSDHNVFVQKWSINLIAASKRRI